MYLVHCARLQMLYLLQLLRLSTSLARVTQLTFRWSLLTCEAFAKLLASWHRRSVSTNEITRFWGCFDPTNVIFEHNKILFSGWRNQYFGLKSCTARHPLRKVYMQELEKSNKQLQKKADKIPEFEGNLRAAALQLDDVRHKYQQLLAERQAFIEKGNANLHMLGQHKIQVQCCTVFCI